MESEGYSSVEASSGESMPEVTENFEFELNPAENVDAPEETLELESAESPSGESMPEVTENFEFELTPTETINAPEDVSESVEEEFPNRTVESEYGDARNKESLAEKEHGSGVKPSGVGDPAESAAAEDQALFDEVQRLREEQETELRQDIEDFNNPSNLPVAENAQRESDFGKVMKNDDEPGISTHLHWHNNGLTISRKDQNTGIVERYNFNTGEGWEMGPNSPMSAEDRAHRLTAKVPDYNPNPDAGTIKGFHSGVWGVSEHENAEDSEN